MDNGRKLNLMFKLEIEYWKWELKMNWKWKMGIELNVKNGIWKLGM